MNPNILKNIGLDSSLNTGDIQLLQQILGSVGQGTNNMPKMSSKERNNLISKLSSNTTLDQTPKKELKDMNEHEKKIYRDELKKKLKNKQNEKKMMRNSNLIKQNQIKKDTNYSDAIGKVSEMMKNINIPNTNSNTNSNTDIKKNLTNIKQETIINNIINKTDVNKIKDVDNETMVDDLDSYFN